MESVYLKVKLKFLLKKIVAKIFIIKELFVETENAITQVHHLIILLQQLTLNIYANAIMVSMDVTAKNTIVIDKFSLINNFVVFYLIKKFTI